MNAFARSFFLLIFCGQIFAAEPSWWRERGVLNGKPADDFAAVNAGQLKNIAAAACQELDAKLPGGAGAEIARLVGSFANSNNFAAINLGQLKAVAKPFYDRLITEKFVAEYPWKPGATTDDSAAANLGQLKNVFSFEIPPRR